MQHKPAGRGRWGAAGAADRRVEGFRPGEECARTLKTVGAHFVVGGVLKVEVRSGLLGELVPLPWTLLSYGAILPGMRAPALIRGGHKVCGSMGPVRGSRSDDPQGFPGPSRAGEDGSSPGQGAEAGAFGSSAGHTVCPAGIPHCRVARPASSGDTAPTGRRTRSLPAPPCTPSSVGSAPTDAPCTTRARATQAASSGPATASSAPAPASGRPGPRPVPLTHSRSSFCTDRSPHWSARKEGRALDALPRAREKPA